MTMGRSCRKNGRLKNGNILSLPRRVTATSLYKSLYAQFKLLTAFRVNQLFNKDILRQSSNTCAAHTKRCHVT